MIQFVHFQGNIKGTVAVELPTVEKLLEIEKTLENGEYSSFTMRMGFSICSNDDQFNKSTGRIIAESRLEIKTIIAYATNRKIVKTKNGDAEKVLISCLAPFNQKIPMHICHIGIGSEPRIVMDDTYILHLAKKEIDKRAL